MALETLVDEIGTLVDLLLDVVMGPGLAGPLALLGGLLIAVSVGIVGYLALGGLVAPLLSR